MSRLVAPIIAFDTIDRDVANEHLVRWGHVMGACNRPFAGWTHGLHQHGELVTVATTDTLIRETCAGFTRDEAVELSRLCAVRRDLSRVVLRLWREAVLPDLCAVRGYSWAVSYQHAKIHSGNLYRFDGWVVVGCSSSGSDPRGRRSGHRKRIWGWCADAAERAKRAALTAMPEAA